MPEPPADQQHRRRQRRVPREVAADRAAHLELIARQSHLHQIRRHLAVDNRLPSAPRTRPSGAEAMEYERCAAYPSSAVRRTSTCWPALWPGQPGTSSRSVVAVAVSGRTSVTVATRQTRRSAGSVTPISLLTPRITVVVVAGALPEALLILAQQLDFPHPLRALPQVQVRYEQPGWPAVLGRQRLAVVANTPPRPDRPGDPPAAGSCCSRRTNAPVTKSAAVSPIRHQRVQADALPRRAELRPLRDAVQVDGHRVGWQAPQLGPRPARPLAGLGR